MMLNSVKMNGNTSKETNKNIYIRMQNVFVLLSKRSFGSFSVGVIVVSVNKLLSFGLQTQSINKFFSSKKNKPNRVFTIANMPLH